jgi:hypothetical protein
MIENFNQILEEHVLPEERQNRQNECIAGHSNQRLGDVKDPMLRMLGKVASPEQSPVQQVAARATRGWHHLISYCFIAPNERTTLIHRTPEKIHVFSCGVKHRPEGRVEAIQDIFSEEDIASAGFFPAQPVTGRVCWAFEKSAFSYPLRRFRFKIWFYRSKNTIRSGRLIHLEELTEPIFRRKFVVIDEGNQVPAGVL